MKVKVVFPVLSSRTYSCIEVISLRVNWILVTCCESCARAVSRCVLVLIGVCMEKVHQFWVTSKLLALCCAWTYWAFSCHRLHSLFSSPVGHKDAFSWLRHKQPEKHSGAHLNVSMSSCGELHTGKLTLWTIKSIDSHSHCLGRCSFWFALLLDFLVFLSERFKHPKTPTVPHGIHLSSHILKW